MFQQCPWLWLWFPGPWDIARRAARGKVSCLAVKTPLLCLTYVSLPSFIAFLLPGSAISSVTACHQQTSISRFFPQSLCFDSTVAEAAQAAAGMNNALLWQNCWSQSSLCPSEFFQSVQILHPACSSACLAYPQNSSVNNFMLSTLSLEARNLNLRT